MGADVLAMQGAGASATMIFTMLNRINAVPAALKKHKIYLLYLSFHDTEMVHEVEILLYGG